MAWEAIVKSERDWKLVPNLRHYGQVRTCFSWEAARRDIDGLPAGNGLNFAHEAVDRHVGTERADHLAIRWLGKSDDVRDFTYRQLGALTNRFDNVLRQLGVDAGGRSSVCTDWPHPCTLYCSTRHAEES